MQSREPKCGREGQPPRGVRAWSTRRIRPAAGAKAHHGHGSTLRASARCRNTLAGPTAPPAQPGGVLAGKASASRGSPARRRTTAAAPAACRRTTATRPRSARRRVRASPPRRSARAPRGSQRLGLARRPRTSMPRTRRLGRPRNPPARYAFRGMPSPAPPVPGSGWRPRGATRHATPQAPAGTTGLRPALPPPSARAPPCRRPPWALKPGRVPGWCGRGASTCRASSGTS